MISAIVSHQTAEAVIFHVIHVVRVNVLQNAVSIGNGHTRRLNMMASKIPTRKMTT